MLQLYKQTNKQNQFIFFKSSLGNITIFFIDQKVKIPQNIKIQKKENQFFFKGPLGNLDLKLMESISFFKTTNYILLSSNEKANKKKNINLNIVLIKLKIKGVLQGFKLNLFLKGIGFKAFIEDNVLILKLGYSHDIRVTIPENVKIINQTNQLIFKSIDWIFLTQYVHFIKRYKKPEPYKGKGLLLKNEFIIRKEGKKSKK